MKNFILTTDWHLVAKLAETTNWPKYSSYAFQKDSEQFTKFKEIFDKEFNPEKPRGINYSYYVKLISTAKALGLF